MKLYWLDAGLRLEPETENEMADLKVIETAIRTLAGMQIAAEQQIERFSDPRLDYAALGSAKSPRQA